MKSFFRSLKTMSFILTFTVGTGAWAAGSGSSSGDGTASGGGGNLCYLNKTPYLLEFADLAPQLREPGMKIAESNMTKLYGFGLSEHLYKDQVKDRVDAILAANTSLSPILVSWLQIAVKNTEFSFVSANIAAPVFADTSDQPFCQHGNTRASILYFPPLTGFADLAQINSLDLDSQAGLVIHEGARALQAYLTMSPEPLSEDTLAVFSDLKLQRMVRALFEVYKGRSNSSIDSDELILAFTDIIMVDFARFDLCLGTATFDQARLDLYRDRHQQPQRNDPFTNYDIWARQDEIKKLLPPVFAEACAIDTSFQWAKGKKLLQKVQTDLKAQPPNGTYANLLVILKQQIAQALANPFRKPPRDIILKVMPEALNSFFVSLAMLQLDLTLVSINVDDYYEVKKKLFISEHTRQKLRAVEVEACIMRESLSDWFKTGASASTNIGDLLKQPHSNCSKN